MIRNILAPLDGSSLAEVALGPVAALARAFDAEILLLRVVERSAGEDGDWADCVDWRLKRAEARSYLEGVADDLKLQGLSVGVELADGRAAEQVVATVSERDVDLVVLSAFGWGGVGATLGGVAQKVVALAGVSILLLRPKTEARESVLRPFGRVLVPLDGSPRGEWALSMAASIAKDQDAKLVLLRVVQIPDVAARVPEGSAHAELRRKLTEENRRAAGEYLADIRAHLPAELDVSARVLVAAQVPSAVEAVADEGEADLVVLSAHGATGGERWPYGGVTTFLLAHASHSILVLQDQPSAAGLMHPEETSHAKLLRIPG